MKIAKISAIFLCGMFLLTAVYGCSKKPTFKEPQGKDSYSLCLGVLCEDNSSVGQVTTDIYAAALLVDAEGKIVDLEIDCAENVMSINGGSAQVGGEYKTKNELGEDYGMEQASSIGKEWDEQVEYFCEKLVGKTKSDVESLELDKGGRLRAADISAGCTISASPLKSALLKAFEDKESVKLSADKKPEVKLSALTEDSTTMDAKADKDGASSMFTTFAAVADVDGRIYGAIIDTAEPTVPFNAKGEPKAMEFDGTKRELGKSYGMLIASTIGKEWNEQAAFFCNYIRGMTEDEVAAIKIDAVGKAEHADLKSGCTVTVKDYVKAVRKALD